MPALLFTNLYVWTFSTPVPRYPPRVVGIRFTLANFELEVEFSLVFPYFLDTVFQCLMSRETLKRSFEGTPRTFDSQLKFLKCEANNDLSW